MAKNGNNSSSSNNSSGGLIFRLATTLIGSLLTIITTLSLFITTGIKSDVKDIDAKLFSHLTNHDLHRIDVVSMSEYKVQLEANRITQNEFAQCIKELRATTLKDKEILNELRVKQGKE
jgi:hypothetical protein